MSFIKSPRTARCSASTIHSQLLALKGHGSNFSQRPLLEIPIRQEKSKPKKAAVIFRRLTDLQPQRWVEEWMRLREPWEQKGAELGIATKTGALFAVSAAMDAKRREDYSR
jgi:hypothetical protein